MARTQDTRRLGGPQRGQLLAVTLALTGFGLSGIEASAQDLEWVLSGAIEVVPGTHGTTLRLQRGSATLQGVEMQNGSISFVMKATAA